MLVDFDVRGQQVKEFLRRKRSYGLGLLFWICFLQTHSFSLNKILIDGLELCELLVEYCDVFIRCLDSLSDGTHSLQRIH